MRLVLTMLWRDLRSRVRDRSALVIGVLAPLALIAVLSFTAGGPDRERLAVGLAASPTSANLAETLRTGPLAALVADGTLRVSDYPDRAALEMALRDEKIRAALFVADTPTRLEVIRGSDATVAAAILDAVATGTASVADATGWVAALQGRRGLTPSPSQIAAALSDAPPAAQITDAGESAGGISIKASIAAGLAVFFLFFTVQFGVLGLLEERRQGVLRRTLAAPVRRWQVVAAKVGVSYTIGVAAMGILAIAVRVLLGARWGHPLGVAALILSGVAAAVSTITLVVGAARTPEQAGAAQSIVAMALGILGGSFFDIARTSGVGAQLTKLTPHYWFREGLVRISGDRPWTAALTPSAYMLLFAAVVGIPGLVLANRTVRP